MKRLVLAAAVAAASAIAMPALAAPPAANAAKPPAATTAAPTEHTSTGVVKSFASSSRELQFKDGRKYQLAASISTTPKAGDKVNVRWTHQGKIKVADNLTMSN